MALLQKQIHQIIEYVKGEPRTVQDVAKRIGKSWVTTNSYIEKIIKETGQIKIKTFRQGTQGAIKLIYYNYAGSLEEDELKSLISLHITNGRYKTDFDFMDIYQHINDKKKRSHIEKNIHDFEKYLMNYLEEAQDTVFCLSGNLSFLSREVLDSMEKALKRKVHIKILCRITLGSLRNISPLLTLLRKYPQLLEVRHRFQPLRGFIIDGKALFREDEKKSSYREGEIIGDVQIIYEIMDQEWVDWLRQLYWHLYRPASDGVGRMKEFEKLQ